MYKQLRITLILGAITVVLGAFAAHGLKKVLTPSQIESFQTGIRYQFIHILFLLFVLSSNWIETKAKKQIFILCLVGVGLFSGSIYLLSTELVSGKIIGPVTPIGGLVLISTWIFTSLKIKKKL